MEAYEIKTLDDHKDDIMYNVMVSALILQKLQYKSMLSKEQRNELSVFVIVFLEKISLLCQS